MDPRERFADCTDNELMRCTAAGQKTAYEVLILRHRKAAEGCCLSLIRDEREAEDIVQDSFADIYVQREAYRDTFSFQAYLYAVIRHKASDHLRRAGRSETLDETVLEAVPGREPSPEEEFLRGEETDRLAEWIMDLPENYREALYLFCVEGRSYQETALEMGRSVPQVKIWIYRARKKLQKRRMEER